MSRPSEESFATFVTCLGMSFLLVTAGIGYDTKSYGMMWGAICSAIFILLFRLFRYLTR